MKSLKLLLIAAFIAAAMVNTANAGIPKVNQTKQIIKITYTQAIQDAGLVAAMHQQLTGGFLGGPVIINMTFRVTFQNHVYLITGTSDEWTLFFNCYGITEKPKNP